MAASGVHVQIEFPISGEGKEELLCIEYPGLVKNTNTALQTLGEEGAVQESFKSIAVRYRPHDPNCHPVMGRKRSCTGFLLKCKRRLVSEGRSDEAPIKAECVGMVTSIVEFSELCDFQALHPGLQKQKNPDCVSRDSYEIARLLNGKDLTSSAPLFLPPMSFSKFSVPMKSSVYGPCASTGDQPYKKFSYASHAVGFDLSKAVPEHGIAEPVPSDHPHMVTLAKLFEERPIWSRSGIDARCHIPQLKKYLGSTAYHFTVGPWRLLWVKFGYDPRKDTKSKIYQSIDFRVPREYSDVPLGAVAPQTKSHTSEEASSSTEIPDRKDKPSVVFGPSNLPTQKFSIYQLCDLQDDALQDIVHANDGNEPSECHSITGWCESQAYDKIRKRMAEVFRAAVDHSHQEIRNTPTKS